MPKKKVIHSVINDLVTDQRVNRACRALTEAGFEVLLVGRKLKKSPPMPETPYAYHRMRLVFTRGPLFYAEYNIRLFLFLLFKKADILHSNDLDTLLANYLVAKMKKIPVVFDSHEYFTGVPELMHNHFARNTWKKIERYIVPKLNYFITVNRSISDMFREEYQKDFKVLRNVPLPIKNREKISREMMKMPVGKKILLIQGNGINIHRGAEEMVEAMQYLDDTYVLYIIGDGDVIHILKSMVQAMNLTDKVFFVPRQTHAQLIRYTLNADLGISLDRDNNINYKFSLPNKLFDYIQAHIPVLSSDLVELRRIIDYYNVGWILPSIEPQVIADKIREIFSDENVYREKKNNTEIAAMDLHWDEEKKVLLDLYMEILEDNNVQ